jgi:hypothetical protein
MTTPVLNIGNSTAKKLYVKCSACDSSYTYLAPGASSSYQLTSGTTYAIKSGRSTAILAADTLLSAIGTDVGLYVFPNLDNMSILPSASSPTLFLGIETKQVLYTPDGSIPTTVLYDAWFSNSTLGAIKTTIDQIADAIIPKLHPNINTIPSDPNIYRPDLDDLPSVNLTPNQGIPPVKLPFENWMPHKSSGITFNLSWFFILIILLIVVVIIVACVMHKDTW